MEGKKDCFGYKTSSYCSVLTEMVCRKKGKCSFYKTKQEFEEDLIKYGWNGETNLKELIAKSKARRSEVCEDDEQGSQGVAIKGLRNRRKS